MQETNIQRKERRNRYISYVLAHTGRGVRDRDPIIKEATLKWENNNPEIFQEVNRMWKMRG